MKPRTKLQIRVFALSQSLPEITPAQKDWAFANCLAHEAYRNKTRTACLDCGHTWPSKVTDDKECVCPSCGATLVITDTAKKKADQLVYAAMLDVLEEYQVVRLFEVSGYYKAGAKPTIWCHEIIQQFITIDGNKDMVVAKTNKNMGGYSRHFRGDLEIREGIDDYNYYADFTFPGVSVKDIYARNGFTGEFYGSAPYNLFTKILSDSKGETLLKAKQGKLFWARINGNKSGLIYQYWDSIKICIRNNYFPVSGSIYLDYLDLLTYFQKDLRNPKYICPADLKSEHDALVAKKQAIQHRERIVDYLVRMGGDAANLRWLTVDQLSEMRETARANQNEAERKARLERERKQKAYDKLGYENARAKYFDLAFTKGKITITVLRTVAEFEAEAADLQHCLFTNGYHKKEDSLILSAKVNGKRMETVEVSLSKLKVMQSRGIDEKFITNSSTAYHNDIVALVNKNMHLIQKARDAKKVKKSHPQHEVAA